MLAALVGLLGTSGPLAAAVEKTFWLPRQASNHAGEVDFAWAAVYWLSVFFFALVTFLTVFFVLRYRTKTGQRNKPSPSHHTPLEIFWSVVPTLLVVWLFWVGYSNYINLATPPANSYEIQVTGQKWNWLFTYPNGYVDGNLHVPKGTDVTLTMTSEDVLHSFFAPEFRVKRDVIPGRYTKLWFNATVAGEYDIFCTEYCGTSHSTMLSKLVVHERADFDAWLEEASDFLSRMPPAEAGEMLYNMRGCKQCHSVDGASGHHGPDLRTASTAVRRSITDGTSLIAVDENYIHAVDREPDAAVADRRRLRPGHADLQADASRKRRVTAPSSRIIKTLKDS